MMNYELFKEVVAEKFTEFMPEEFRNCKVDVHSVTKVNKTMDALNLVPTGDEKYQTSPTIYINNMYEHYKECDDLQAVLQAGAETMQKAFQELPNVGQMVDFDQAKDNIVMVLINTEQNKSMLESVPNRQFQDLSIIYRWVIDKDKEGISSTIVNNGLAEKLGMNEVELYNAAVENTIRLFPPTIKSMNDVIRDMFIKDGMPDEIADMMIGEVPENNMMYVISNERGVNGAVSMLYEDNLHQLAEKLETDLYIMPSSIHETIAVSCDMGDPNELAQMVNEINMDQVALEERLSNQVYHYDKDLRKLSMATDTPNKRLDGIVAEPKLIYDSKEQSR